MDSTRTIRRRNRAYRSFPLFEIFCRIWPSHGSIYVSVVPPQADIDFRAMTFAAHINTEMCRLGRGAAPLEVQRVFSELVGQFLKDCVAIYTDGSKSADISIMVRAGIDVPHLESVIKHKLPSEATVFSAEAWAVLQAIFLTKNKGWGKAVIFTDSLSVIKAIMGTSGNQRNHLICNIKKQLCFASMDGREICICWVPAHKGVPGDKVVDEVAITTGETTCFKVPYVDLQAVAAAKTIRKQRKAEADSFVWKGRMYFEKCWLDASKLWFHQKAIG